MGEPTAAHRPAPDGPPARPVLDLRPDEGLARIDGTPVPLAARELELLAVLLERAGHVVGREELYARAWGSPLRHGDRIVDVYVRKLRVKLEGARPGTRWIHTHVGFGYRLDPEAGRRPGAG